MTESTWKILKLDWKTPGIFFFQKSGNPVELTVCQVDCIVAHDSCEGRLDHVMANIDTLFQAPRLTSIPLYLMSGESLSCLLHPGKNVIEVNDERCGRWCSLVPIGHPCPRVTTTGLKYNVSKYFWFTAK